MRDSWISVDTELPPLSYIGENWTMSKTVLTYGLARFPKVAYLNYNKLIHEKPTWEGIGKDTITHWMYIKVPKEYEYN